MVDFFHFNDFFLKTSKINNIANNHPILAWFVLNDVEYDYL